MPVLSPTTYASLATMATSHSLPPLAHTPTSPYASDDDEWTGHEDLSCSSSCKELLEEVTEGLDTLHDAVLNGQVTNDDLRKELGHARAASLQFILASKDLDVRLVDRKLQALRREQRKSKGVPPPIRTCCSTSFDLVQERKVLLGHMEAVRGDMQGQLDAANLAREATEVKLMNLVNALMIELKETRVALEDYKHLMDRLLTVDSRTIWLEEKLKKAKADKESAYAKAKHLDFKRMKTKEETHKLIWENRALRAQLTEENSPRYEKGGPVMALGEEWTSG